VQGVHHDDGRRDDGDRAGKGLFQRQREDDRRQPVLLGEGEPNAVAATGSRPGQRRGDHHLREVGRHTQHHALDDRDPARQQESDRQRGRQQRDQHGPVDLPVFRWPQEKTDEGEREQQRERGRHDRDHGDRDHEQRDAAGRQRPVVRPPSPSRQDNPVNQEDNAAERGIQDEAEREVAEAGAEHTSRDRVSVGIQREGGDVNREQDRDRVVEGGPRGQKCLPRFGQAALGRHRGHRERIDLRDRDGENDVLGFPEEQEHHQEDQRGFRGHAEGHGQHDGSQLCSEQVEGNSGGRGVQAEAEQGRHGQ
jgi:hypothetical protein